MSLRPIAIDVARIVRTAASPSLRHLVTRPTGRAVRRAIEARLERAEGSALSAVDLGAIAILDFSCADEVVAKLLQRFERPGPPEIFFVFRGVHEPHRDQVEYVLERQGLAVVAETAPDAWELLGARTGEEAAAWLDLERAGRLGSDGGRCGRHEVAPEALDTLVRRRLAYRSRRSGEVHALPGLAARLLRAYGSEGSAEAPPAEDPHAGAGRSTHDEEDA